MYRLIFVRLQLRLHQDWFRWVTMLQSRQGHLPHCLGMDQPCPFIFLLATCLGMDQPCPFIFLLVLASSLQVGSVTAELHLSLPKREEEKGKFWIRKKNGGISYAFG